MHVFDYLVKEDKKKDLPIIHGPWLIGLMTYGERERERALREHACSLLFATCLAVLNCPFQNQNNNLKQKNHHKASTVSI